MSYNPSFQRYIGDGSRIQEGLSISRREQGRYIADPELALAVNTALAVDMPLLVTGAPGTGKTTLAWSIASELGLDEVLECHIRSDHQARDIFYRFDSLRRFYDAQNRDPRAEDPENYIAWEALGQAFRADHQCIVLLDEIDKAPRDFPNDLLDEIEQKYFVVRETGKKFIAAHHPIIIITSNSERELPAAFLRRCIFHHISFPRQEQLLKILDERLGDLRPKRALLDAAAQKFLALRDIDGWEKKPATHELIKWVTVLVAAGLSVQEIADSPLKELPLRGALIKTDSDRTLLAQHREARG